MCYLVAGSCVLSLFDSSASSFIVYSKQHTLEQQQESYLKCKRNNNNSVLQFSGENEKPFFPIYLQKYLCSNVLREIQKQQNALTSLYGKMLELNVDLGEKRMEVGIS